MWQFQRRRTNQIIAIILLICNFVHYFSGFSCVQCSERPSIGRLNGGSFLKRFNDVYWKHLLYHPFHRLHKKHLFHLQKNHQHKQGNHSSIKKRKEKKANYKYIKTRLNSQDLAGHYQIYDYHH